jgi:hypothetical protein
MGYIASTAFNVFHDIVLYFEEYPDYLRNMNRDQFSELANTVYDCMRQIPWEHKLTYNDRRHLAIRDIVSMRGPKQILSYVKYVFCEKEEATKNDTLGFDFFTFDSLYCDYLSMAYNLKDTESRIEHPQYKFDSLEEVQTAHDNILFIYDMATDKKNFGEKQSLFEQVWTKEKCDRYQYEGDTFSVLAPKNVMEIANEGTVLHHCVKSYIDNVAHDVTNILFIRRNENLEKPFYTLEIQNDEVRQCHGFGNCNIDKEEGLEEFLKEYCKKKDFLFKTADRVLAAT